MNIASYDTSLIVWSHRLTVRTPGSHPGNPGSIPGEITKVKYPSIDGYFTLVPPAESNSDARCEVSRESGFGVVNKMKKCLHFFMNERRSGDF